MKLCDDNKRKVYINDLPTGTVFKFVKYDHILIKNETKNGATVLVRDTSQWDPGHYSTSWITDLEVTSFPNACLKLGEAQ